MELEKAIVGAKVYHTGSMNDVGVITNVIDDETVEVNWDPENKKSVSKKYDIEDLHIYDPEAVAQIQSMVDEAKDAFQLAFDKLAAAAKIAGGYESEVMCIKYTDGVNVKDLETVIQNNGWSSSSLWC